MIEQEAEELIHQIQSYEREMTFLAEKFDREADELQSLSNNVSKLNIHGHTADKIGQKSQIALDFSRSFSNGEVIPECQLIENDDVKSKYCNTKAKTIVMVYFM